MTLIDLLKHTNTLPILVAVLTGGTVFALRRWKAEWWEALPKRLQVAPVLVVAALMTGGAEALKSVAGLGLEFWPLVGEFVTTTFLGWMTSIGGHHAGKRIAGEGGGPEQPERPSMRIIGGLLVLLALLCSSCTSSGQVHPLVAAAADPLLEVIGFCQRNGAKGDDVEAILRDYHEDRKLDAAIKAGLLMHQLAETEGVEIPPEIDRAYRMAVGAIVDGMVEGLKVLDCVGPDGKRLENEPGCT